MTRNHRLELDKLIGSTWHNDTVAPDSGDFHVIAYLEGPRLTFNLAKKHEQGLSLLCGTLLFERYVHTPIPMDFIDPVVTSPESLHLVLLETERINISHPVVLRVLEKLLTVKVADISVVQNNNKALALMVRSLKRNDELFTQVLELAAQKLEASEIK